jgi:hypothetical protein
VAQRDLKHAQAQFQQAESRARQAYENAEKGTVTGQVFVSSEGGDYKLSGVEVRLHSREAIDVFLAELKRYRDIAIELKSREVDAAEVAMKQSDTVADRENYQKALNARADLSSGSFYFMMLPIAYSIEDVKTDAEGKFVMNVLKQGSFVLLAKAEHGADQTSIGQVPMGRTKIYTWLLPVSLDGKQHLTQDLSNTNLTRATGTSSLIHTQD